jgi:hypothetical protein
MGIVLIIFLGTTIGFLAWSLRKSKRGLKLLGLALAILLALLLKAWALVPLILIGPFCGAFFFREQKKLWIYAVGVCVVLAAIVSGFLFLLQGADNAIGAYMLVGVTLWGIPSCLIGCLIRSFILHIQKP